MKEELIAPCGMNCRLGYGYIRACSPCFGCRSPDETKPKSCTSCKIVTCEKRIHNHWADCSLCDTPCRRIKELDKRYRTKYHMSMLENLAHIYEKGMDSFLRQQQAQFACPTCGKILSVHRRECPSSKTVIWDKA